MWRCLLIEDDQENSRYIKAAFQAQNYEVTVAYDGPTGLELAQADNWDLIILDRMLPNSLDGLSILSTLREKGQQTPVLVLSALAALDDRVKGLRLGGDDYLTKPFALTELLARAEALVRRARTAPDIQELSVGDLTLDLFTRQVQRAGQSINLQPREFRLLAFLMKHEGQVVTRTMLLESVWEYYFDPQTNVIDVQVSRLRNKIDTGFDYPLIHTIRGSGYMLSVSGI